MRESQLEKSLCKRIKEIGGMCVKFVSPGLPGVPDRIVILPGGRIYFVELKTEIGRLANIQKWVHSEIEARNADVRTLRGIEEVKAFVKEVSKE